MSGVPKGMKEIVVMGDAKDIGGGRKVYKVAGRDFEVPASYTLRKSVGYGAYGLVCSAVDENQGKKVAVKKVQNVFRDVGDCKRVLREVKLLRFMKHENILGLCNFYVAGDQQSFQDVYLVSDLLDTDLNTVIRSRQKVSEDHVRYFIYQVLRGLKYIHSAKVLHRDLKPANLLVNINCDLQICDFGLARGYDVGSCVLEMTDYVITRWYRPPELLLMSRQYTMAIDVWSVGCIFAELINRAPLFPGKDYISQISMICESLGIPSAEQLRFLQNKEAMNFVLSMPPKPPRPFSKLLAPHSSPMALDFLGRMLQFNPNDRASAAELMGHPFLDSLHDPEDEPVAEAPFVWEFDTDDNLSKEKMRELFWEEKCASEASNPRRSE